jgi:hypothetical protein
MAVPASIKQSAQAISESGEQKEIRRMFEAGQQDLANLRAAFVALTAKLDLDAGVTDTNYGASTNPAALFLKP